MRRTLLAMAVLSASLLLAACGASATADDPAGDAADAPAGMCAPEMTDCDDTAGSTDGSDPADFDVDRENARALLGIAEGDLPQDVRVGRRGEEHLMLTEDYQVGRRTVELDPDAEGVFRVTKVVLEAEEGPETYSE